MTSVTDNAIAMIESDQMQKRTVASVGRRIKIRPGHATQHHLHSSSFHWQMKLLHQRGVSKRCCTTTTGSWERSSRAFPGKYNASPHGKDERSRGRKKKWKLGTRPFRSFGPRWVAVAPSQDNHRARASRRVKRKKPFHNLSSLPARATPTPAEYSLESLPSLIIPRSGFETDRKLASLDAMIPNSSQMAAFFRSMGTVRHGMF